MKHLIKKILREETYDVIIRQFNPNTDFELIYNNYRFFNIRVSSVGL